MRAARSATRTSHSLVPQRRRRRASPSPARAATPRPARRCGAGSRRSRCRGARRGGSCRARRGRDRASGERESTVQSSPRRDEAELTAVGVAREREVHLAGRHVAEAPRIVEQQEAQVTVAARVAREQRRERARAVAEAVVGADDLHGARRRLDGHLLVVEQPDARRREGRAHLAGRLVIVVAEDGEAAPGDRPERRERLARAPGVPLPSMVRKSPVRQTRSGSWASSRSMRARSRCTGWKGPRCGSAICTMRSGRASSGAGAPLR